MPNQTASFAAVVIGGVIAYSGFTHRRVIDVLLMRQGPPSGTTVPNYTGNPNSSTGIYSPVTGGNGSGTEIAAVAKRASTMPQGTYEYSETRPYPKTLFSGRKPIKTDCSGFATLCYKEAGARDPNGANYDGLGFTGTLLIHGRPTKTPRPGDLAFWHAPDHVAVYIGGGQCIGFGAPPGPIQDSIDAESKYHSSFLGYRTYR